MLREFDVTGRLSRGGFWLRHVTSVPLGLWMASAAQEWPGPPFDLPISVLLTVMLVSIWGRRLHDRGRSAWWLLATLVPVLGALFLVIECGFRASSAGASRFGREAGVRADYLAVKA